MARIEISSVSNPYGTGELQLQGKVAMSGTLTAVTDNLNNASPLKLSTGGVQVASTLQITTNSNPYIDAEDGAGNNRFTVGRDPSSQVVNVDFASNPTGGTNQVGAIRTYTDGVNLAEVMSFRKDGLIGVLNTNPQSALDVSGQILGNIVGNKNGNPVIGCDGSNISLGVNLASRIIMASNRTDIQTNGVAVARFSPSGNTLLDTTASDTARLSIKGSGSTSATVSLLVQNSSSANALQIYDNFNAVFGSTYLRTLTIRPEDASGTYGNSCSIRGGAGNGRLDFYSGGNITQLSDNIIILSGTSNSMQIGPAGISASISGNAFSINSTTQGFLPPRMTTIEKNAIVSPAIGLMVFDTTLNRPCFYNGIWVTL